MLAFSLPQRVDHHPRQQVALAELIPQHSIALQLVVALQLAVSFLDHSFGVKLFKFQLQ